MGLFGVIMTKAQRYKSILADLGCVLCRRDTGEIVQPELHHIAEGSGQRSDWMLAPLCVNHHRIGSTSLHGAGVKRFLIMQGLSTEYHQLELVNKFRSEDGV